MPNKTIQVLLVGLVTLMALALVFIYDASQWFLLSIIASIALLMLRKPESTLASPIMQDIIKMLHHIRGGKLEYRVTHIPKEDPFYGLAWLLNNAIDQVEAVMRESESSFTAAEWQEYYRKPLSKGISQGYHAQLANIAKSVDSLANSYWKQKQDEMFSTLGKQKSENLLENIAHSQRDLGNIAQDMVIVEELSKESVESAINNQGNANTLHERLNVIVDKSTAMRTSSQELAESSEEIKEMVSMIVGVAEQTNLLALNAAIEAARAGEHGRGFAVVADEVRTLASRTQESTEQIQKMVSSLQMHTHKAVEVMDSDTKHAMKMAESTSSATESIDRIVDSVTKISDMSTMVASASEEQSLVSEEINRNIVRIADLSVESMSGSEQIALGSDELAKLASELEMVVEHFKV